MTLALPALKLLQVVPVEDHRPGAPPFVSVATGQQLPRAGSSSAVRRERVSVGEREEKSEISRPVSSGSSSGHSVRTDPSKQRGGGRPTSAPQQVKMASSVVSKTFSYAQALKSVGQPSITPTSSYISSRSQTPPSSPFCPPQPSEDKSVPCSPLSGPSEAQTDLSKPEGVVDDSRSVSQMSAVESVEEVDTSILSADGISPGKAHTENIEHVTTFSKTVSNEQALINDPELITSDYASTSVDTVDAASEGTVTAGHNPRSPMPTSTEQVITDSKDIGKDSTTQAVAVDTRVVAEETEREVRVSVGDSQHVSDVRTRPPHLSSLPVKGHQSQLPTAHVLPMPHSTAPTQPPEAQPSLPHHPHTAHLPPPFTSVPPHALTTVTPRPHSVVPHTSVHAQPHPVLPHPNTVQLSQALQGQHMVLPSYLGEHQKPHLPPNLIPEQGFPPTGQSLFGAPPGMGLPPQPVLPGPVRPAIPTKSHEQLEAIAKVREHMAVTNALEAQRKTKSNQGKPEPHGAGQRPYSQTHSEVGLLEQAPGRLPEMYSSPYPFQMGAQPSAANQGLYQKQPPLLSQPPTARHQSLLPAQLSSGEQFPPHVSQLQHAAAIKYQLALYHQQQQARKLHVAALQASQQGGRLPSEIPIGVHHGYSVPQMTTLPQASVQQTQGRSAFSPYYSKTTAEPTRVMEPQATTSLSQPAMDKAVPTKQTQEVSQAEADKAHETREQSVDSGKSALSAAATPFVPSSIPDEGKQRTVETVPAPDKPLLPSPAQPSPSVYQQSLPLRAPQPVYSNLAQPGGATFMRQTQLPVPVPQQMVSPGFSAPAQQRKISLTGVPAPLLPTGEGQLLAQSMLALQQQQVHKMMMQQKSEGALAAGQLPPEVLHLGQRKGHFSPANLEHQAKHMQRMAARGHRIKHDSQSANPAQASTLLNLPTAANPRRAALLPTPSTASAMLLSNAPRLSSQGTQQWQAPPPHQVIPLSHNPASLLTLSAQEQLRVSSMYGMSGGPTGRQY